MVCTLFYAYLHCAACAVLSVCTVVLDLVWPLRLCCTLKVVLHRWSTRLPRLPLSPCPPKGELRPASERTKLKRKILHARMTLAEYAPSLPNRNGNDRTHSDRHDRSQAERVALLLHTVGQKYARAPPRGEFCAAQHGRQSSLSRKPWRLS